MGFIDKMMEGCKKWDPLFARLLVGGMFVFAGGMKFMGIDGTAGYIASTMPWLPMPVVFAYLAGALEVLGGLSLITGYYFRYGALALALFTIVVTAFFHSAWGGEGGQMQMTLAMKNGGILAALLYMKVHGPGPFAIGVKKAGTPPSPAGTA